jgi:transposase
MGSRDTKRLGTGEQMVWTPLLLTASHRVPKWKILEDAQNGLSGMSRELFARLLAHFRHLDAQVQALEAQIKAWHKEDEASRRLEQIPGIGPLSASALVASIGDARNFKNGRQLSAWLGLVPEQDSSGGKPTLLGISKRGDVYLRTLLIHGARSILRRAKPSDWGAVPTAQPELRGCSLSEQKRAHRLGTASARALLPG